MFKRVDAVRPGQEAALTAETLLLLGGLGSTAPQPGRGPVATIVLGDHADALLPYCSGTGATAK